jgi:hypothetical protein
MSNASPWGTALAGRGDVTELIEPVDDPTLAPPWVREQQIANGQNVFRLFPAYRLPASTCHILTTFLFNNIPAFSG